MLVAKDTSMERSRDFVTATFSFRAPTINNLLEEENRVRNWNSQGGVLSCELYGTNGTQYEEYGPANKKYLFTGDHSNQDLKNIAKNNYIPVFLLRMFGPDDLCSPVVM